MMTMTLMKMMKTTRSDAVCRLQMFLRRVLVLVLVLSTKSYESIAVIPGPVSDNFILFVDGPQGRLFQMSLNGTTLVDIPLEQPQNPVAVDYDPLEEFIYWTDIESHTIRRKRLHSNTEEPFVMLTPASSPEGLALDPSAQLLFYTDNGRNTINVVSTRTREHRVLVTYAKHPRTVQVDPINRYIYWTDWGLGSIERATYTGQDRTVVVQGEDRWINGLALDLIAQTLYWTDAQRGTIERANMNGTNKTVLIDETIVGNSSIGNTTITSRPHYYGIAVDTHYMYYTDWQRGVFRANIDGTKRQRLTTANTSSFSILNGIKLYRSDIYSRTSGHDSPCRHNNGGCTGLCIPTSPPSTSPPSSTSPSLSFASSHPSDKSNSTFFLPLSHSPSFSASSYPSAFPADSYVCECADFRRLAEDNFTCINGVNAEGPDIIWVEQDGTSTSYVRGVRGEPKDFLRTRDILTWSIRSPAWRWTALDMNYGERKLYLADKIDRYLVELSVNGSLDLKIILSGTSSAVNGIAVDWVAGNIYWTDGLYKWIAVARAVEKTSGHKTLLSTGLDRPQGIAVWPQKGLMYWSDWGTESKIQYASMLGEKVTTLVNTDLIEPKGLALDYVNNRLFWCNRNSIESIFTNGTVRLTHAASLFNNFVDLSLHMNYVIATEQGMDGREPRLWVYDRRVSDNSGFKLGLHRQPYGVIMYDARRQDVIDSPCVHLGCEHLCITMDVTRAQCVCYDGFIVATDKQHCIGDRICSVLVRNAQSISSSPDRLCFFANPTSPYEFRGVDVNYRRGEVFFSETKFRVRSIRRAHLVEKQNNSAVVHGVGIVKGIAVDWIAENIYWTDSSMNQVWMSRSDGRYQRIIARNLAAPYGIVIDQMRKKLYWCESGLNGGVGGRIVQSNLDGTNAVSLFIGVQQPAGLDIEYSQREDKLFWTDRGRNTIESLSLTSLNHQTEQIPVQQGKIIADVASYQDFLAYTAAEPGNVSSLHIFEKLDGKEVNRGIRHYSQSQPYGVVVFAEFKQPLFTRPTCGYDDNGGCEQLLIQTLDGQCLCTCSDGFILDRDGRSCVPKDPMSDNFFLVADDYRYQIYQMDSTFQRISAIRFPPQDRPIAVEYDFQEERFYWTDFETGVIKRSFLNGSAVEIIQHKLSDSRIDGLALATQSRLLYFTDADRGQVGLMTLNGQFKKVLIRNNLSSPRAIVLDEQHGMMYIAIRNTSNGRIDRCHMDGTNCLTIIQSNTSWPNGLAINIPEGQLYWCDSHTERIEAAMLDGSSRHVIHVGRETEDPFGLALQGSYVYWTDWNMKGISRINVNGSGYERKFQTFFRGLNDIKFYNKTATNAVSNVCSANNGGCSHFCIPTPSLGRACACPDSSEPTGGATSGDGRGEETGFKEEMNNAQELAQDCSELDICPMSVNNGRILQPCAYTVGSYCQFVCIPGYVATTKEPLYCQHDMQWNKDTGRLCVDATCPMLVNADNSVLDSDCPLSAPVGVTCTQRCADGYKVMAGDVSRTCTLDLRWSGQPLVCALDEQCPTSRASPGTQCRHRCMEGYQQIDGDSVRVCDKLLRWAGVNIRCIPERRCPILSIPSNAAVEPGRCHQSPPPSTGQECKQYCQPGFLSPPGNWTRTCLNNQSWTGAPIICSNESVLLSSLHDAHILHGSSSSNVGLVVGLTFGMLLVSALVVLAVVILWRMWMTKSYQPPSFLRSFSDLSQFRFRRDLDEDLQPVVTTPSAFTTPPAGGLQSLPTPVYFSKSTNVHLTFDNPIYQTPSYSPAPVEVSGGGGGIGAVAPSLSSVEMSKAWEASGQESPVFFPDTLRPAGLVSFDERLCGREGEKGGGVGGLGLEGERGGGGSGGGRRGESNPFKE